MVALCAIGVLAVLVGALVRVEIKVTRELAHPEPPSEPVYHMIVDGAEPELVEAELEKRPSVLSDYRYGSKNLLHLAVVYERFAILQLLLARGSEPDMGWREHPTPLLLAVMNQKPQFVEALLDAGADPFLPSAPAGLTPYEIACNHDDIQSLEILSLIEARGEEPTVREVEPPPDNIFWRETRRTDGLTHENL